MTWSWIREPRRAVVTLLGRRATRSWREQQAHVLGAYPFSLELDEGEDGGRLREVWCPRCRAWVDIGELGPVFLLDGALEWFHLPHGYWPPSSGWRQTVCARTREPERS